MQLSEKHMDLVTQSQIHDLLSNGEGPCVSILLPTARRGGELQQNIIRFRKLLHQAETGLKDSGIRKSDTDSLLAYARDRITDNFFWQFQSEGLAVFLAPDRHWTFRLPLDLHEDVVVGRRFYVKPLLPVITGDGRFFVLALSQKGARLYQGTHYTLAELMLEHVPASLAEALKFDVHERSVQFHSGTSGAAGSRTSVFHGQGAATDDAILKRALLDYLRKLDHGVCEALKDEHAPLVLAGGETIRGLYREANHHRFLADQDIDLNTGTLTPEALHARAWDIVKPIFRYEVAQSLQRFHHLAGTGDERAGKTMSAIIPAAHFKRVDTLFAPLDQTLWGRFDPGRSHVEVHKDRKPGDEDLLDLAGCATLRNGGKVHGLERDAMPGGLTLAAIFRDKVQGVRAA